VQTQRESDKTKLKNKCEVVVSEVCSISSTIASWTAQAGRHLSAVSRRQDSRFARLLLARAKTLTAQCRLLSAPLPPALSGAALTQGKRKVAFLFSFCFCLLLLLFVVDSVEPSTRELFGTLSTYF
jgi:hypothetical protein